MENTEHSEKKCVFRTENLTFGYKDMPNVLDNITFTLFPGQAIGLAGPNGSGKTTFFKCITGLLKPRQGRIYLGDEPMRQEKDFVLLRRKVGFVLQNSEDQIFFPTVLEDVEFGPLNLDLPASQARARAMESLKLVGMENYADRISHKLSGGEKKLVALAGILAMRPEALLLDEPQTGLDDQASERLKDIILNLACAKIIVAHDKNFLDKTCDRTIFLENGRLVSRLVL